LLLNKYKYRLCNRERLINIDYKLIYKHCVQNVLKSLDLRVSAMFNATKLVFMERSRDIERWKKQGAGRYLP